MNNVLSLQKLAVNGDAVTDGLVGLSTISTDCNNTRAAA